MESIVYLRYSDLFDQRIPLPTLKKKLRQFNLTNLLITLSRINILLCRQHTLDRSTKKRGELQSLLADHYMSDETLYSKLKNKYDPSFNPIFTRQQMLFLFRLSILTCSENTSLHPNDNQESKFRFGECCLIASDHLGSRKEEKAISEGSDSKRTRHIGYQLAPVTELYNPVSLKYALVRSEILYGEILKSQQFKQALPHRLASFNMDQKFLDATGITINQYRGFTVAVLSNVIAWEDEEIFNNPDLLTFKRYGFLLKSKVKQSDFDSYLTLESKTIQQFKASLVKPTRRIRTPFSYVDFRVRPLLEFNKDSFIPIDPCFLIEKLGSGIYWKILDSLKSKHEKDTFLELYGALFEEYVNSILNEIPVYKGLFIASPEYDNGEKCFDGIIYYPETKHLLALEYKSSFMRIDAKYGGGVRDFEKELKKKFVAKEGNKPKGVGQLTRHIEYLFQKGKNKRRHLKDRDIDSWIQGAVKISPILIPQELLLHFPTLEGGLNKHLNQLLNRRKLRAGIHINQLTVIDIDTLERIKPCLVQDIFTLEQCVNARAHRDKDYKYDFYSFLYSNFIQLREEVLDKKIEGTFNRVWERIKETFFDPSQQNI